MRTNRTHNITCPAHDHVVSGEATVYHIISEPYTSLFGGREGEGRERGSEQNWSMGRHDPSMARQ